jgi:putative hydrolase of the HAD superfamily
VLFDVYGTLFLQSPGRRWGPFSSKRTVTRIIKRHRLGTTPAALEAALRREILEAHAARKASGVEYPEVRIERIWRGLYPDREDAEIERLAIAWELAVHPAWPMPGSADLIAFLRAREMALGIVSNAQFYTPLYFEAFFGERPEGLGFRPELCIYSFEHGAAKPQKSLFELAARRLADEGIGRHETLMVGNDPLNDIASAASCGFMTAFLTAGFAEKESEAPAEQGSGPDVVIGALADLQALLR